MADRNRQEPDPSDETVRGGLTDEQIRGVADDDDDEFDDAEDADETDEEDEDGTI